MKTISSSLTQSLNGQNIVFAKKVLLYPRVWNGEEYVFSSPADITPYILEISDIKWKLDSEGYGIWNNANTTLSLSNAAGKFTQGNSSGFLPEGSLLYGAKAEIFAGARNSAGQKEYVKIFRGFALDAASVLYNERTLSLTLSGELARLACYSAADICLSEEGELLGFGSGTEFTTSQKAVGEITNIYRGSLSAGVKSASALTAEQDYQVSSLNQYSAGAKITLTSALIATEGLWADYRRWYTDKPMEWIAEEIAKKSASDSYSIDSVYYDKTVSSSMRQPAQFPFSDGQTVYTEIGASGVNLPASFLNQADFDWSIGENPPNLTFTFSQDGVKVGNGIFSSHANVYAPQTNAYGTWQAEASCDWEDQENHWNYFISSTNNPATTNGYCFTQEKYLYNLIYTLYKVTAGNCQILQTVIVNINYEVKTFRYRIARDSQGNFKLWIRPLTPTLAADWHAFGTIATDNTYTTCNYQMIDIRNNGNSFIANMKLSPLAATGGGDVGPQGSYLSPVMDGTQNLIAWGNLEASKTDNSGSSSFYYRTRNAESDAWGAWQSLAAGSAPSSSLRYLQLKWEALSDAAQTSSPVLSSWSLNWNSRGVNIALVNTASMTFSDVMQELARLSGYLIGYDSEGKFLFKARSEGAACGNLNKSNILEIESISDGTDKLYNRVSVSFGSYKCVTDPLTSGAARPNLLDKYGVKELSISSGSLLPPDNSNLALAAAPEIYQNVAVVKKRAVLSARFMPQIELGDIFNVSYDDVLSGEMRVEGIEFDLTDWQMRLNLTEV